MSPEPGPRGRHADVAIARLAFDPELGRTVACAQGRHQGSKPARQACLGVITTSNAGCGCACHAPAVADSGTVAVMNERQAAPIVMDPSDFPDLPEDEGEVLTGLAERLYDDVQDILEGDAHVCKMTKVDSASQPTGSYKQCFTCGRSTFVPVDAPDHPAWVVDQWKDAQPEGQYSAPHDPQAALEQAETPRQYRGHANAKGDRPERRFDTTALHYEQHGRLISHADYLAHCEKYDYVWRSIRTGDRILDIGCGTDAPLMRAINFVQGVAAKVMHREGGCYVGVDMNKLKETNINWARLLGEVDMTSDAGYETAYYAIPQNEHLAGPEEVGHGYTLIVCLEVIEHMAPKDGKRLVANMKDLLAVEGRIVLSTPVYDGKGQARNHIHEYFIDELRQVFIDAGLQVTRRMGTFTSEPVIRRWLKANRPDWLALYDEAKEFHSAGFLSGLIAPMVPDFARNNLWVLAHA